MAGKPLRRFTVMYAPTGQRFTVKAQSHRAARDLFAVGVTSLKPPAHPRQEILVYPQDDRADEKVMHIGTTPKNWRPPPKPKRRRARGSNMLPNPDMETRAEQERVAREIQSMSPAEFRALQRGEWGEDWGDDWAE